MHSYQDQFIQASVFVVVYDSTAQESIKEWGHTNKSKGTDEHTKHKPSLGLCFVCSFVPFDLFVCPHSFMFP